MPSVLYVDDEEGLLEIAKLFLENDYQFQVDTARSAHSALESPAIWSYDAIISDYQMPGMDGIEFLKAVRRRCRNKPFILFTGRGREDVVIDAINNGADFYLQKGGDPKAQFAELAHKVRQAIARRQSENEIASVLQAVPVGIAVIDDRIMRRVNPHLCVIAGYSREELEGRNTRFLYVNDEDYTAVGRMRDQEYREGKVNDLEVPWQGKDGRIIVVRITAAAIDRSNPNAAMTYAAVDVTDEIRNREELIRSRQRLDDAMGLTSLVTWEYDPESGTGSFDDRLFRFVGRDPETEDSAIPKTLDDFAREFLVPENRHFIAEGIRKALDSHDPHYVGRREARMKGKDGRTRDIIVHARVIPKRDGKGSIIQGTLQDVTEEKRAGNAIRLANKKLTLLGSLTRHDIGNKIATILGYLRIAETKVSDPEILDILKKIESNTEVIRKQMQFSKIYQELGVNEPQWIDLDTAIRLSEVPQGWYFKKEVAGIRIYADPMFGLVFFNLLDNAVRHGQHVSGISVSSHVEGGDLVLFWEDNGIGIAPENKERIFEQGFGDHTGLGLFLIREILSLTGITIIETGEYGRGARFEIRVPQENWSVETSGTGPLPD